MGKAIEMLEAVTTGNTARTKELLQSDPALANAKSPTGDSAFLLSVYYGRKEVSELLLAHGAQLNAYEAAAAGRIDQVRASLREDPSRIRAYSHDGFTLLHLAAFFGHRELAEFLLAEGADINAVSKNQTFARGVTPLHSALAASQTALATLLIDKDADLTARDADGNTPLHSAAFHGNIPIVQLLLAKKAEVNSRNTAGSTPVAMASQNQRQETVDLLRQRGGLDQ
jgi:ankyrin repeat protein